MPQPAWKPYRTSWNAMEVVRRQLIITVTTFHTTSTRPMPQQPPPPLGISTTACQVDYFTIQFSRKAA